MGRRHRAGNPLQVRGLTAFSRAVGEDIPVPLNTAQTWVTSRASIVSCLYSRAASTHLCPFLADGSQWQAMWGRALIDVRPGVLLEGLTPPRLAPNQQKNLCCSFFGREIAAYDIQTKRCDVYGQDEGHSERVMLVYDGLHYDALAVAGE